MFNAEPFRSTTAINNVWPMPCRRMAIFQQARMARGVRRMQPADLRIDSIEPASIAHGHAMSDNNSGQQVGDQCCLLRIGLRRSPFPSLTVHGARSMSTSLFLPLPTVVVSVIVANRWGGIAGVGVSFFRSLSARSWLVPARGLALVRRSWGMVWVGGRKTRAVPGEAGFVSERAEVNGDVGNVDKHS